MSAGTSTVTKTIEPFVDTANLLLIDRDPLGFDSKKEFVPNEADLLQLTRANVQCLFNEVWKLPRSTHEDATCAQLPTEQKYRVPREKPIPQKAPMTRWQKFAQSKGIGFNKQKDKKVWDENSESWKPRYGYNRAGSDKDWLIEIPENKDPNVDYFQERSDARKERVAKNQLQQLKNVKNQMNEVNKRNQQDGYENKLTTSRGFSNGSNNFRGPNGFRNPVGGPKGANAIPLGVTVDSRDRNRTELGYKIHHAKQATASAGKFQDKLKGEKTPKLGIKRKFEPNEQDAKSERSKQMAILDRMAAKKPKINQARINAAAEASQHTEQKQQGGRSAPKRSEKMKRGGRSSFKQSAGSKNGGKMQRGGRSNSKQSAGSKGPKNGGKMQRGGRKRQSAN